MFKEMVGGDGMTTMMGFDISEDPTVTKKARVSQSKGNAAKRSNSRCQCNVPDHTDPNSKFEIPNSSPFQLCTNLALRSHCVWGIFQGVQFRSVIQFTLVVLGILILKNQSEVGMEHVGVFFKINETLPFILL